MKYLFFKLSVLVLIATPIVALGQTECSQPFSYRFDSVDPYDEKIGNDVYKRFSEQVLASGPEARGHAMIYGGKNSYLAEIKNLYAKLSAIFDSINANHEAVRDERFQSRYGGYKSNAVIELWVSPSSCTQKPEGTSEYGILKINFREAPLAESSYLGSDEFEKRIAKKVAPTCPAAARAVMACKNSATVVVEMIADTRTKVLYSKAISGHPLLRNTAKRAVDQWKFKRLPGSADRRFLRGTILVKFEDDSSEIVDY